MRKFFYLTFNLFRIDIGLRGLLRLLFLNALVAIPVAFVKSQNGKAFDWHLFLSIFPIVTFLYMISNILSMNSKIADVLSPKSGRKWQMQRKASLSGVIARINAQIQCTTNLDTAVARVLLTDILDIIVSHVRDYRGSHSDKKNEVFANILIESGSDLVVVVRNSLCDDSKYHRPVPVPYRKATLLCGRAIDAKQTLSVGHLKTEYRESPQRPYNSILAIPLIDSTGAVPYGCLSVDCSRPYFFNSFSSGVEENKLENTLQPYLQLITMVFEKFCNGNYLLNGSSGVTT